MPPLNNGGERHERPRLQASHVSRLRGTPRGTAKGGGQEGSQGEQGARCDHERPGHDQGARSGEREDILRVRGMQGIPWDERGRGEAKASPFLRTIGSPFAECNPDASESWLGEFRLPGFWLARSLQSANAMPIARRSLAHHMQARTLHDASPMPSRTASNRETAATHRRTQPAKGATTNRHAEHGALRHDGNVM